MNRPARTELKRSFQAVREVLHEVWNPVGAHGLPADEYDSYVWPIVRLLRGGAGEATLTAHLLEVGRAWFAADFDAAQLAPVVQALRALAIEGEKS